MSVHACTPSSDASAAAAARFNIRIDADRRVDDRWRGTIELDRRPDDAGAERLGEDQRIAGTRAAHW